MRNLILWFILQTITLSLAGQVEVPEGGILSDETEQEASNNAVPSKESPFSFFKAFSGNPGKAALYSALIPSAGQVYNKNYWKVPVVLAAEGTALFLVFDNARKFRAWRQGHIDLSDGTLTSFRGATTPGQARRQRDQFQQFRDFAIIGTVAIHIIQIADAFIHRHLVEFDVSDNLSFSAFTTGQSFTMVMTF